jgi:tetratricopeptide (TPR) repeat protein
MKIFHITIICLTTMIFSCKNSYSTDSTSYLKNYKESIDNKVLEERIKQDEEKSEQKIQNLKDYSELDKKIQKNELEIESLEKRIYTVAAIIAFIVSLASFFGWKSIKKTIQNYSEEKIDSIIKNEITEERIKSLVIEKEDLLIQDIIREYNEKFQKTIDEYQKLLINLKSQPTEPDKPANEDIKKKLNELEEKLTRVKTEEYYDYDDWYYKGLAERGKANYRGAIEAFTKAIILGPQDIRANILRGYCYDKLGEYKFAIEDSTRVIELGPNISSAYIIRGRGYYSLKQYQKAIEDYTKVFEFRSDDFSILNVLAEIHIIITLYQKSLEYINKVSASSQEVGEKIIAKYLEIVANLFLNNNTEEQEKDFGELIQTRANLGWSFNEIEEFVKASNLEESKKTKIQELTNKLKEFPKE